MTRAGEFSIPRNRIGRHLRTFNERSDHVGFGDQWIDDKSRVMRIHGPDETPVAGPRIHFYFHKTGPNAFIRCSSFTTGNSAAELANGTIVFLRQSRKSRRLFGLFGREDHSIANPELCGVDLQGVRGAIEKLFASFMGG